MSSVMKTYGRIDLSFVRGKGPWLYTSEGNKYLDFASGIAVNTFGHGEPDLVSTLIKQSKNLWHTSNLYNIKPQEQLADLICNNSFGESVFFCNSGAEAIEGVIKLLRRYHYNKGFPNKKNILVFSNAFHGRTISTLAAGDNDDHRLGFGVNTELFIRIPLGNIGEVEKYVDKDTAGILIEPVQGEGGINFPPEDYLPFLREVCSKEGILLAFDEVQSGMGRTGKLFAHQWYDALPDVMGLAKGLGGGFPIGAVVANKLTSDVLSAGTHGSTFGGNFLAAAVAKEVLTKLLKPRFLDSVLENGDKLMEGIKNIADKNNDIIIGVRGKGLMIGIESKVKNTELVEALRDENLLAVPAAGNIVRFLPPLNIDISHVDIGLKILDKSIKRLKMK